MSTLHAPFNFVPLNGKVYFPDWADRISHDVPFSDGLSGTITFKLTAKTPIFVRNGQKQVDPKGRTTEFSNINCPSCAKPMYFIPGTSIKGSIRSVLEILSFAKLVPGTQDQSFYVRELGGDFYANKVSIGKVFCGWLRKEQCGDGDKYMLRDCGIPYRISAKMVDDWLSLTGDRSLDNFIKDEQNFGNGKEKCEFNKSAQAKYKKLGDASVWGHFRYTHEDFRRKIVCPDEKGEIYGCLVLTGQPSVRVDEGKGKGKHYEFIFRSQEVKTLEVPLSIFNEFKSLNAEATDWKDFRKPMLNAGKEIPVFFTRDSKGQVEAMGLAYMFKYPAYHSVHSAIPAQHHKYKMDLAECIFGRIDDSDSLKGRVQFGHAFAKKVVAHGNEEKLVLSTPHPSYYPLYLINSSWNSASATIAGRKRYPVRDSVKLPEVPKEMENLVSQMCPLGEGTEFCETVRFFNLRPEELGALLAAITFCGHHEKDDPKSRGGKVPDCHHSFGSGKPFGLGKTSVSNLELEIDGLKVEGWKESYIDKFCGKMKEVDKTADGKVDGRYTSSWDEVAEELFAMARGIPKGREKEFEYMSAGEIGNSNGSGKGSSEFSKAKSDFCEVLDPKKERKIWYPLPPYKKIIAGESPTDPLKPLVGKDSVRMLSNAENLRDQAHKLFNEGEFENAMELYEQALDYYNVRLCELEIEKQKKAKEEQRKAKEEQRKAEDDVRIRLENVRMFIGNKDYDEALILAKETKGLAESLSDPKRSAVFLCQIEELVKIIAQCVLEQKIDAVYGKLKGAKELALVDKAKAVELAKECLEECKRLECEVGSIPKLTLLRKAIEDFVKSLEDIPFPEKYAKFTSPAAFLRQFQNDSARSEVAAATKQDWQELFEKFQADLAKKNKREKEKWKDYTDADVMEAIVKKQ